MANGEPDLQILQLAEREGCDLIVLGAPLPGSRLFTLPGGLLDRLLRHGNREILVIPQGASIQYRSVLVGSERPEPASKDLLKAMDLAAFHSAALKIVASASWDSSARARVDQSAAALGVRCEWHIGQGNLLRMVSDMAWRSESPLIVQNMAASGGWSGFCSRRMAARLIRIAPGPVWITSP